MSDHNQQSALESPTVDDTLLRDIYASMNHFPVILAADELGVFATIGKNLVTKAEIAENIGLSVRSTQILLSHLTALGLLGQFQERFCLTETSRYYLQPDSPYYWDGHLQYEKEYKGSHRKIIKALSQGYQDREAVQENEEYHDPTYIKLFTQRMHDTALASAISMARQGDFGGVKHLLDMGGGSGCYSIALSMRYPGLRCTVAEIPAIAELAVEYIAAYDCQAQVDTLGINMFKEAWPTGYDAIFFSRVFHNWAHADCQLLAASSFAVLPPGGRIYLHEMLLNDTQDGPLTPISNSTKMLAMIQGEERPFGEFAAILQTAGFQDVTALPTYGYFSLIMAKKPL